MGSHIHVVWECWQPSVQDVWLDWKILKASSFIEATSSLGRFHFCGRSLTSCCLMILTPSHSLAFLPSSSLCCLIISSTRSLFLFPPCFHHLRFCVFSPNSMGQPTNLYFTFLFLLLSPCWGHQRSNPDGERSSCDHCDLRLSCNCSYGGFTHIPVVTDRALSLDLSFNNITVVTADDLKGHRGLRALSLHGNADGSGYNKPCL